jgi:hypothetical protein
MDWTEILSQIFQLVIFPLLGIGTSYLILLIKTKIAELKQKHDNEIFHKYMDMLDKTICEVVMSTNQIYVDTLKKEGKFDGEAQKKAFEHTYQTIMTILTDDAKIYLSEAIGDLQLYVQNKIESEVMLQKA